MSGLIYELENLLIDPDYYVEEYFRPIINEIDIITETKKLNNAERRDEFNKERETLFSQINSFISKCKNAQQGFNEEIDRIQQFFDSFDSKSENSRENLEENIKELKLIILRFHSYYLDKELNEENEEELKMKSKIIFKSTFTI